MEVFLHRLGNDYIFNAAVELAKLEGYKQEGLLFVKDGHGVAECWLVDKFSEMEVIMPIFLKYAALSGCVVELEENRIVLSFFRYNKPMHVYFTETYGNSFLIAAYEMYKIYSEQENGNSKPK